MIKIENFRCGYRKNTIIDNLDFIAQQNEITSIQAPSGYGKSTLHMAINRLHEEEGSGFWMDGKIFAEIDGTLYDIYRCDIPLPVIRRKISYIFQNPAALPMSIFENTVFAMKAAGISDSEKRLYNAEKALKNAFLWEEVKDRLDKDARILSAGQLQRLAIARSLVMDPDILLFDEPTSSLDPIATAQIEDLILSLKKERTVLLVSHDRQQLERLSDKIIEIC